MAPLPMSLNDLEGQFHCLKPVLLPYLVKHSTNLLNYRSLWDSYSASCIMNMHFVIFTIYYA